MKTEENIALIKQQLSDFKIDLGSIKELLDVNVTTAKKLSADEYQSISVIFRTAQAEENGSCSERHRRSRVHQTGSPG